ncbi:MAG: 3'-5' exonuclease [Rikenellaceae bacterium]
MSKFQKSITNDALAQLPIGFFEQEIVVVENLEDAVTACEDLSRYSVIGFDTETKPSFKAGVSHKIALLQLSSESKCYLFRLSQMALEKPILKLLGNKEIIKVGAAVRDDIKGLKALRQFTHASFIDLQSIVSDYGIEDLSLRKLAAITMGIRISKAQRLSNWEANTLTLMQQRYAATDAWVSLMIYKKLTDDK